jgi:hypothetical protein
MSNTPETDANQIFLGFNPDEGDYFVPAEIARKLEQQRDRLIYALFMCRRELVDVLDDINKERVSYDGDDFHEALRISKEALAAVKGDNNE